MLDLYIYTLKIGHKSCKILCILNELTLQKELQHCVTDNVLLEKKLKHNNNKTKNETYKPLPKPGIETGTSCTQGGK